MKYAQWIITFANGFKISETIVTSWIIMLGLIIAAFILTRDLKPVPKIAQIIQFFKGNKVLAT